VTVFSGLAPNFLVFVVMRGLYGLGMGGYWGIGASYAMESAPVKLRGVLSGLMQGGYPMGYLVAAVVMQTVTPHLGWRSVFFVGAPVALLIVVLTAFAPESKAWHVQRASSFRSIVRSLTEHKGMFLYLLALMAVMLSLSHGTQDLYPDFLKSMGGLTRGTIVGMKILYGVPVLYNIAAVLGAILFGLLSERTGRRYAIMIALVLSLIAIPPWAFGHSVVALVIGSCILQAGVQGAFGVIPAHLNELSPRSVRGLFPGFVYQLGMLIASPATMVELKLRDLLGYSRALAVFVAAIIVVLLFFFYFGPEERGKDFSEPIAGPA
jgi:SHS family lactate transporter-like MFS transporter